MPVMGFVLVIVELDEAVLDGAELDEAELDGAA